MIERADKFIQPKASNAAAARRVDNYPAQVKRSAGLGEQEQIKCTTREE